MKLYLSPLKNEPCNIIAIPNQESNSLTLRIANNLGIVKAEIEISILESKELIFQLEENMKILHKKYKKARIIEEKKITPF